MLSRFQVTFVVGDEYNGFSVRGDVGEPGVTGFVKGHLGLFGAVCLHAPDLHESGAYGIEPDVLSAGGIFRSVIQTFGSGQAGFFTSFRRDGIDVIVAVSFGAIGKLFAVGAPAVEVAGSHRCY